MFRFLIFILTIAIIGMSVTISTLNTSDVQVDLHFVTYTAPLPFFLLISFFIGCLLTLLFFLSAYVKHKHENINLRKSNKIKEDEIDNLRKSPLREDR
tara:strand:+ start:412 stop:705 length:294 start_codon:yes stop_codon:yes gene_type:complete